MLTSWVNDVVILAFGVMMGSLSGFIDGLNPRTTATKLRKRQKGESWAEWWNDYSSRVSDDARRRAASEPKSVATATTASGSLMFLLIGVVIFSPIEMRWPLFFAGFFGSYLLMKGLFVLAKLNKVRVTKHSFLDRAAGSTMNGGSQTKDLP